MAYSEMDSVKKTGIGEKARAAIRCIRMESQKSRTQRYV